ncbi:MAG TPA: hypothetical protein PK431_12220 [Chitinophagales bacterium]|nr:hypothetical protein [Chitinophagales bacterium]
MAKIGIIQVKYASNTVADKCPICNKLSELEIALYQGAFVIGFPLFPTSKKSEITCTTCKNSIPFRNAPNFAIDKYDTMVTTKKPSIWIYTFSYFIVVMMIWVSIQTSVDNGKFKKYIDDPKIGDVYETKTKKPSLLGDKSYYSFMKIVSVNNSRIGFKLCLFEATAGKISEIKNKPEDEKWSDEVVYYTKEELKQNVASMSNLDQKFVIDDIER